MSWQAYIDTSLVGTGAVDRAAIFSATGDSVWATSPAFNVSPTEMQAVVAAYKDPGNKEGVKKVQSEGLHIAGERFVVLKADDRSVYGKKVSWLGLRRVKSRVLLGCGVKGETLRREGVVIVKTTQAILVTHYPESVQPGVAANTVETLADYLVKVGY
ncbi:hypothetical protein B0A54_02248 [Friedmanniomyces endolithicus]|uniref:Profilin n=1 Tax=Friedmanniomyces endolithicus TaxID=329885 RepID=A0A4U0VE36_9PEZI|nr:hypothetical protein B0A54_02248 [Friedmanniomyces endolithicus]